MPLSLIENSAHFYHALHLRNNRQKFLTKGGSHFGCARKTTWAAIHMNEPFAEVIVGRNTYGKPLQLTPKPPFIRIRKERHATF